MKKRIGLILLAAVCLFTCFAGCKHSGREETPSGTDPGELNTSDPNSALSVPEHLFEEMKTVTVLTTNTQIREVIGEDEADQKRDAIEESIYKRDRYTEQYLNVAIKVDSMNGMFEDRNNFLSSVENAVLGGVASWDLIGAYSMIPPALALRGVLTDLRDTGYLDFNKAWWPQYMLDICTTNGKTYSMTGDISSNLLFYMQAVMFNISMVESFGISPDDLYNMVLDGDWTLERFLTMTETMSRDDGNGSWGDEDFYAIGMESTVMLDSFYFACGMTTVNEDGSGKLIISEDILGEKVLDVFSMVYDAVNTYHSLSLKSLIQNHKSVFQINTILRFRYELLEEVTGYSVLPFPKYAKNDEYQTLISAPHAQYCIPGNAGSPDASSALMEVMGYASYAYVTPAIYEETMKLKYSMNDKASQMFDIMRSGATSDIGILNYMSFTAAPQSMFRNAIELGVTNWVSNYRNKFESSMMDALKDINGYYSKG